MTEGAENERLLPPYPIRQRTGGNFRKNLGEVIDALENHYLGEGEAPLLVEQDQYGYVEKAELGETVPVEFADVLLHLEDFHRKSAEFLCFTRDLIQTILCDQSQPQVRGR